MTNVVVHITLPKGLRLMDGRTLSEDVTVSVISQITPFYAGIEQVRLWGGVYLKKLSDLTIAPMIWEASKTIDAISYTKPPQPPPGALPTDASVRRLALFEEARNKYCVSYACMKLILNIYELSGARGSHTLGNLSVMRQSIMRDEGMPKKISDLEADLNGWATVVKSGGDLGMAGHVKPAMAAKGKYDPDSLPPGRLWVNSGGMGANSTALPGYGSEGKPFRYASPPIISWRKGLYTGSYVTAVYRGVLL